MVRIKLGVYKCYYIKERSNKLLYIEYFGTLIKSFNL